MRNLLLCSLLLLPACGFAQTVEAFFARAKAEKNPHSQIELLNRVLEKSPQHVGAYHYRADAYRTLGNTREALQDYNRVIALRPQDPFRYYARGLAYHQMKEYASALADFSKAISLKPNYENFYLARARAYRALGKYAPALADYKTYAGTWQGASVALLREVIPVSLEAYRYADARDQLLSLQQRGDDSAELYLWQGKLLHNDHQLDEAISAFSKAINRRDTFSAAYQQRAAAFKELGDFDAALEDYTQVVRLTPQAYWYNKRGLLYEEAKDYENALADYKRAVELDPKWAVAYNNRGFAKLCLKDFAGAKEDFETAIKLDASAPTPYINLAATYWNYKKDRKHMYQYLQKAADHNFKDYEALYDNDKKGWLFKGINQTAEFRSLWYN